MPGLPRRQFSPRPIDRMRRPSAGVNSALGHRRETEAWIAVVKQTGIKPD